MHKDLQVNGCWQDHIIGVLEIILELATPKRDLTDQFGDSTDVLSNARRAQRLVGIHDAD